MKPLLVMIAFLCRASFAAAQEDEPRAPRRDAAEVARDGTFNPQTLAARIGDQRVAAVIQGGYDTTGAVQGATVNAFVEGALYRRIALRVGIHSLLSNGPTASRNVYSVGLRVGLARQELHGLDVGVSATYRSTGLTETTGELEFAVLLSRRWNHLAAYTNLVYGQGFVSSERDAEVRLGMLYAIGDRFNVGFDGLARFDLASTPATGRIPQAGEADFELLVGPVATVALGPMVLLAQAGSHTVIFDQTNTLSSGFAAIAGLGTAF